MTARKPSPPSPPASSIDRIVIGRIIGAAGWTTLIVGLAAAWIFGLPWITARAVAQTPVDRVSVTVADAPAWLDPVDLESIQALVVQNIGSNVLDRRGLIMARQALLETGWFEAVRQVRRDSATEVVVEARFVQPFALVRDAGGDHLVDRDGHLMARTYPTGQGPALWVLIHPSFERPRSFGHPWPGAEVSSALAVLRLVEDRPWSHQIRAVDLADFPRDRRLRLITDRDTEVIWGRAPGAESAAEVPAARKVTYLDFHHDRYGHIDGGVARAVDVTIDMAVQR